MKNKTIKITTTTTQLSKRLQCEEKQSDNGGEFTPKGSIWHRVRCVSRFYGIKSDDRLQPALCRVTKT